MEVKHHELTTSDGVSNQCHVAKRNKFWEGLEASVSSVATLLISGFAVTIYPTHYNKQVSVAWLVGDHLLSMDFGQNDIMFMNVLL